MNLKLITSNKSTKLLEVNIGLNLHDPGLGSDLLDMIPKAQSKKPNRMTSELLIKRCSLPRRLSRK